MKSKKCTKCGKRKRLKYFYKHKTTRDGYHTQCKKCCRKISDEWAKKNWNKVLKSCRKYYKNNRQKIYERKKNKWKKHPIKRKRYQQEKHLKYKFNLTLKEYKILIEKQKGKCLICNKKPKNKIKKLSIDHDHKTGKIRGLLCHNCNVIIGLAHEDIKILKNIAKYLQRKKQ